jgi:hypothetical protein
MPVYADPGPAKVSVPDPYELELLSPDPDSRRQKLPTKIEEEKKFHVLKCWMFSFEG